MEPVEIEITLKDIKYTVIITHIGEVVELPDGGGEIPIEYHTIPDCPQDDVNDLHEEINEFVVAALRAAIKSSKDEEE